jgi:hypothetical protein
MRNWDGISDSKKITNIRLFAGSKQLLPKSKKCHCRDIHLPDHKRRITVTDSESRREVDRIWCRMRGIWGVSTGGRKREQN